ncbi:MAG TPA: hypothetical protein VFN35_19570, partial [Ktedonobacteraceae bacterium]|nr:hypothetical protein [Ktedonobacteraceae bacterium]
PTIKAETLDDAVWSFVTPLIEDPQKVEEYIETRLKAEDPTAPDREAIERSLRKVQEEQENLLSGLAKLDPVYAGAIYRRLNELADLQKGFEKNLKELESTQRTWEEVQGELQDFKEWCAEFRSTVDKEHPLYNEKLRAIQRFNIKVRVYRRDPVTQKPMYEITAKPIHCVTYCL